MCCVHGALCWPSAGLVRIYLAANNCTDMAGALRAVLTDDDGNARHVHAIETFAGQELDTIYTPDANGDWTAKPPTYTPHPVDDGEPIDILAGEPAAWCAPMPFTRRPGTTVAEAVAIAVRHLNAKAVGEIDREINRLRAKRDATLRNLSAEVSALPDGDIYALRDEAIEEHMRKDGSAK